MQKTIQSKSSIFGVRYVSKLDIAKIEKMNKEAGLSLNYDQLLVALKDIDCVVLSIEYKEIFIGYAVYKKKDKFIKLLDICIDPYYRRQGAGTAILDYIKKCGAFRLNKKIMCCADEYSLELHLFLRANGFKCTSINKYGEYKFQYEQMD